MSEVEDLLRRHVANMQRIEQVDRECATNLCVLQNAMVWSTGAYHVYSKGNKALAHLMDDKSAALMEVMSGGSGIPTTVAGGSDPSGGGGDVQPVADDTGGLDPNS